MPTGTSPSTWSGAQEIGGYRSAVAAPLLHKGNVVGVIFVAKKVPQPFTGHASIRREAVDFELSQNERIVGCRKRQRRLGVIRIGGFSAFGPNITLSRLSASIRA
jgi:hypothetical protein